MVASDELDFFPSCKQAELTELDPGQNLPPNRYIQGKATGISQDGTKLYISSPDVSYTLNVGQDAKGEFAKLLKARVFAIDVSGAKVSSRVSKSIDGVRPKTITQVEIFTVGKLSVEMLTKDSKVARKVLLAKDEQRKPVAVLQKRGSPPPSTNSWALSSTPDEAAISRGPPQSMQPAVPSKRKSLAPAPHPAQIQQPMQPLATARRPSAAFRGLDPDLIASVASPAKKRKVLDEEALQTKRLSLLAAPERLAVTGNNLSGTSNAGEVQTVHADARRSSTPVEDVAVAAPSTTTVNAEASSARHLMLEKAFVAYSPSLGDNTQPQSLTRGTSIRSGASEASTTSRFDLRQTMPTAAVLLENKVQRQKVRVRLEAKELAKRAEEECRAAKRMQELAGNIEALESVLQAGMWKYTPLVDLRVGSNANVIAVVVDAGVMQQGSQLRRTVMLADPGKNRHVNDGNDTAATLFALQSAQYPPLNPGDVLLLRSLKAQKWGERTKLLGVNGQWSWALLSAADGKVLLSSFLPGGVQEVELQHMRHMLAWGKTTTLSADNPAVVPSVTTVVDSVLGTGSGQRHTLLQDVKPGVFFDCTVQVLEFNKLPPRQNAPRAELIVTDGTAASVYPARVFTALGAYDLSPSAIFAICMWQVPDDSVLQLFTPGAFIRFINLRPKLYCQQLEIIAHEKNVEGQEGFKNKKRFFQVDPDAEEAQAIKKRLQALRSQGASGTEVPQAARQSAVTLDQTADTSATACENFQSTKLARHVKTLHTEQKPSTIHEICNNLTIPNKYRLQARVTAIHPRNNPKQLIARYCKKCEGRLKIGTTHCQSCNDDALIYAEYRYFITVELKQDDVDESLCAVIPHAQAAKFLPNLPRLVAKKSNSIERDLLAAGKAALDALLGAPSNGKRPTPIIDFSVQSYYANDRPVLQVFDMTT